MVENCLYCFSTCNGQVTIKSFLASRGDVLSFKVIHILCAYVLTNPGIVVNKRQKRNKKCIKNFKNSSHALPVDGYVTDILKTFNLSYALLFPCETLFETTISLESKPYTYLTSNIDVYRCRNQEPSTMNSCVMIYFTSIRHDKQNNKIKSKYYSYLKDVELRWGKEINISCTASFVSNCKIQEKIPSPSMAVS